MRVYCADAERLDMEKPCNDSYLSPYLNQRLEFIPYVFTPELFAQYYYGKTKIRHEEVYRTTSVVVRLQKRLFGIPAPSGYLVKMPLVGLVEFPAWREYYDRDINGLTEENEIKLIMQVGAIIRVSELLIKSDRFFKTIKNVIPVLNEYDKLKHDFTTRVQLLRLYEFLTNWKGMKKHLTRSFEKMSLILGMIGYYKNRHKNHHKNHILKRFGKILTTAKDFRWVEDFEINTESREVTIVLGVL
ncbi:MAG TPA: hypothetical protein DEA64_02955 [Pseudothermotoga sp.]|nr:hypothetical protein [Pseudothermotoga sp.]